MNGVRLLAAFMLFTTVLQAQQLSLFTQYREHMPFINPAAVEPDFLAYGDNLTVGASYRAQWVGLDNAPTTATVRGTFLNTNMSGVSFMAGGHLISDQTGPTGFTGIYGRLAGVISGDIDYAGLSFGITAGAVQYRVDASEIRLRDQNDIVGDSDQTQIFPDVGVGVFYYQTIGRREIDYFYAGVSIPQVLGLDLTFQDDNGEYVTQRVQHIYSVLGIYKFFRNDSFLEPSIWMKYAPNAPVNVDFNLRYQLPSNVWVGAGGSSGGTAHVEAGLVLGEPAGFDNTFKLGYGFDYSFSSFGPSAGTTHEINLTFSFEK